MPKINLETIINESSYIFFFLVVDKFLDINIPEIKNFEKIYLSDYSSTVEKNSGKLLSNPKVIDYILKKSEETKLIPVIIPFKPSAKIDFLCKKHNWILASNPAILNRFLEDKIKFAQLCKKNRLSTIPFSIDIFSQKNFLKYQKKYHQKLVIQTHFGWAGNSTFSSESWDEIKDKISPGILVKFSPFIESSYSLLNNCCLTKFGLIQSPPALQYTGIIPYTSNPFTTVGRQWPSMAPKRIIKKINKISQKFGTILQKNNYKGFFGLDFLVYKNKVFLLECNPRLTASFGFYTKIEQQQNITPLFYFHLAEFLKLDYKINLKNEKSRFNNQKIVGSELTPRDKNNHTIKKLQFDYPLSKTTNPISIPLNLDERK